MANIRDLRLRITSVGNIQKITRAMEMVASTKLRRFQERAVAARPYTGELVRLMRNLSPAIRENAAVAGEAAPLFHPGKADKPHGILFVGSDRGLCGAYNANIQRRLDQEWKRLDGKATLFVIGRKALAHAKRMSYPVEAYFEDRPLEKLNFEDAAAISNHLVAAFRQGSVSKISLCYTDFVSMVRFDPRFDQMVPIVPPEETAEDDESTGTEFADAIFEPDGPALAGRLIPRYLETSIYFALIASITSEYASRRAAMKNATDAAGDMKRDITREYNKARQEKITSELLEVVAGAEAL